MGTIYILENKINGKYYVGQTTKTFKERLQRHKYSNFPIDKALKKYGNDSFNKILIENIPEEKLDELEQKYIEKYNSLNPKGYNLTTGGNKNKHYSKKSRIKNSEAHKGEKNVRFGTHHTEETKKKQSEAHKGEKNHFFGKSLAEDHKKKLSEANKGNIPWNKGTKGIKRKPLTEEHKKKVSKGKKGSIPWNKGKKFPYKSRPSLKGKTTWNKGIHYKQKKNR